MIKTGVGNVLIYVGMQTQEASLLAVAALAKDNPAVAPMLARQASEKDGARVHPTYVLC